jgi:hypothetical protein
MMELYVRNVSRGRPSYTHLVLQERMPRYHNATSLGISGLDSSGLYPYVFPKDPNEHEYFIGVCHTPFVIGCHYDTQFSTSSNGKFFGGWNTRDDVYQVSAEIKWSFGR